MTFTDIRVLWQKHWLKLLLLPLVAAIAVFFFLKSKPNVYTSESVLFTGIASSYNIAGDKQTAGIQMKPEVAIADMLIILKSRETKKDVAFSLIAQHLMLTGYNPAIISDEHYNRFKNLLPLALRTQLQAGTFDETFRKVSNYYALSNKNEIYRLLHSNDPIYSLKALEDIVVYQMSGSEMVQLEYSSPDPAVSQQTLVFLDHIFLQKHQNLFASQTTSVIGYFDTSVRNAYVRLQQAEKELLDFNTRHGILDYDQQVMAAAENKNNTKGLLNDLEVQYSGARATLKATENSLRKRGISNLESQEIIRLRDQLANVSEQITKIEMMGSSSDAGDQKKLASLKQTELQLSAKLKETVDQYYRNSHSAQGVPVDGLVEDYVRNTMQAEQLRGELGVLSRQKSSASGDASKLVPLGPEIRRIRREIDLAQQDYLSQLEGLKQSKLNQENLALAANQVKVLDPPSYPQKPSNKSKASMLAILTFTGILFFLVSLIGARYILEPAIRSPYKAHSLTGLPVLGVIPGADGEGVHPLTQPSIRQLAKQILISISKHKADGPFLLGIASHHSREGKSFIATHLSKYLNSVSVKTGIWLPEQHGNLQSLNERLGRYNTVTGAEEKLAGSDARVLLVEFPPLLEENYPVGLLEKLNMMLLIIRNGRSWHLADSHLVKDIKSLNDAPSGVVLTEMPGLYAEEYTGAEEPAGKIKSLRPSPSSPSASSIALNS